MCVVGCRSFFFTHRCRPALSVFHQTASVDVRLTHNHVTISVSILRPIILLLLNYIARILNTKQRTFRKKKMSEHFFSLHIHDNLQLSARYSSFIYSITSATAACVGSLFFSRCVKIFILAKMC